MFTHVVFTGGGLAGLSYIGVIRYMQENGLHKNLHEVAGTSIGAFFACILAMNVLAGELEDYLKGFFKQEENITFQVINSFMTILETYGIDDGKNLVKPIRHFVAKRYGWTDDVITIREFVKKTGVNIVICATSVIRQAPTYFNVDSTPDVSLYDALQASMSIPILMRPVVINGDLYTDGGVCDNMAVKGFRFTNKCEVLVVELGPIVPKGTKPDSFLQYVTNIVQIALNNTMHAENSNTDSIRYLRLVLDKSPVPFLNLQAYDDGTLRIQLEHSDIDNAIAYGYTKMYEFVQEFKNKKK